MKVRSPEREVCKLQSPSRGQVGAAVPSTWGSLWTPTLCSLEGLHDAWIAQPGLAERRSPAEALGEGELSPSEQPVPGCGLLLAPYHPECQRTDTDLELWTSSWWREAPGCSRFSYFAPGERAVGPSQIASTLSPLVSNCVPSLAVI